MTPDGEAPLVSGDRLMAHTRITILIADAIQEVRLVVLPLRVAGVDFGQAAADREALLVSR